MSCPFGYGDDAATAGAAAAAGCPAHANTAATSKDGGEDKSR